MFEKKYYLISITYGFESLPKYVLLKFKLNNTNMRNNYITPTCEEIEINLDSTVLQSSVLPSGFEDGGEIWN